MNDTHQPNFVLGRHALMDFSGCQSDVIKDYMFIQEILNRAAQLANVTVVGTVERHFEPQGYTAILVLEESHLSIHTWPEYNYVSIDLYSCNLQTDFQAVKNFLAEQFQARTTTFTVIDRGCTQSVTALSASLQPVY